MISRGFEMLAWAHRHLPSPSDASQPLVLSDQQARFVIAFYEVDPRVGNGAVDDVDPDEVERIAQLFPEVKA